jgi:hypothetical protein
MGLKFQHLYRDFIQLTRVWAAKCTPWRAALRIYHATMRTERTRQWPPNTERASDFWPGQLRHEGVM